MEIKNEIQHKMKRLTGMIRSYELIMLILLSVTIGSCYSIESDCVDPVPLPAITINPNPLDFGDVLVNSPSSKNVTIQNIGTANLVISRISIRQDVFTLQNTGTPITIAAGSSRTIAVQFLPTVARDYEGTVTLTHNASDGLSTVQLTGYGSYENGSGSDEDGFWELIHGSPFYVERMTCDANGNLWVGIDNGDVYLYNGTSWQQRGSVGRVVHAIAVAPNGDIYVGEADSLFRSTNEGTTWDIVSTATNNMEFIREIIVSHSGEVYFATTSNNIYIPDGSSWRRATTNGLSGTLSYPIALSPNGTLYAVERTSSRYYVVRSTDDGNNWLRSTSFSASTVYRLTVVDNNTIFVAADSDGILKSTDGGRSWTQCCPTIHGRTTRAFNIIYNSTRGELLAHIDNYTYTGNCDVLRSTDLGESWYLRDRGLPSYRLLMGRYNFAFSTNTYYLISYLDGNRVYRYVCNP